MADVAQLPAKKGPVFTGRPDSADAKAIAEVWEHKSYHRPRWGFGVRRGETVMDMGANIGAYGVYAAYVQHAGQVIGVEAEPTNAGLAARNYRDLIGLPPKARVLHGAIVGDDHEGDTVDLNVNTAPLSLRRHSIERARRDSTPQPVPALRITEVVEKYRPHFLKINIEGTEIPILTTWTAPDCVRALVAEWSFDIDDQIATLDRALDQLRSRFTHVRLSRKIPEGLSRWEFYPPNNFVYAWN